jgi:peptide/nickel transport system substrate-binding protein
MNLASRDFSAVAQEKGIRVVERTAQTFKDVRINTTKSGLSNVDIRRALNYAYDYQGVIRGVYQGHATRMYGVGSSGLKNFVREPTPYVFDLNKAKALVKASGVPKKDLSFTISYLPDDTQAIQVGQIYQADLARIGITTKLQGVPIATYGQLINKPSTDPDIWIGSWTMDYADNQQLYWSYYYSKNTPSNGGANFAYYSDPVTDRLLVQALHAANASAAYRFYRQACHRIYAAAPEVWPVQPNERIALRSNVQGYQYNFLYGENYYPVYNMYRS